MYIYVCSPYGGLEENYEQAKRYGKYVVDKGHTPIIPHTMLHGVLTDSVPSQRKQGLSLGKELMKLCDEVWVFGPMVSNGMAEEIIEAGSTGKLVRKIERISDEATRAQALSICLKEYSKYFRGFVTPHIACDIEYLVKNGITDKLILLAMEKASRKQAQWNYAYGILKNCLAQQIYTAEEFFSSGKPQSQSDMSTHDVGEIDRMLNSGNM